MKEELRTEIQSLEEKVISWRRHFHKYPELSFKEYKTSKYIVKQLEKLPGVQISQPTETSVVGTFDSGKPGRNIALRADIDALPIHEDNSLKYKSVHDGVMHACGHDGHAAILLGVAQILSNNISDLYGTINLIFQHAEEQPPGGAIELYELGVMDGIDEIYGLHLTSAYESGVFGIKSGVLTSATDEFTINVVGIGGHSAFPELSIDPIVIGGEIITAIQTIISRKIESSEQAIISICQIHAGDAYNVIPNTMYINGSVRSFAENVRNKIETEIGNISRGVALAHGANVEYKYIKGYDSVINDPELTSIAKENIKNLFGEDAVEHIGVQMPGEDFSALQRDCKGVFVEVGTSDSEKGTDYPHHNSKYMMDERMLIPSIEFFISLIYSRMNLK